MMGRLSAILFIAATLTGMASGVDISISGMSCSDTSARPNAPVVNRPLSVSDYVTNGLVAFYDGVWNSGDGVHAESPTVWVDLSGHGRDLAFSDTGVQISSNHVTFAGGMATKEDPVTSTYATLDGVVSILFSANAFDLFTFSTSSYARGISTASASSSQACIMCNSPTGFRAGVEAYANMAFSFSFVYRNAQTWTGCSDMQLSDMRVNNTSSANKYRATSNPRSSTYTGVTFYSPAANRPFSVYSIRVYNRVLTDEELTRNYNVDRMRFGL